MAVEMNEALRAAMESAARKAATGSNATDQLKPGGIVPPDELRTEGSSPQGQEPTVRRTLDLSTRYLGLALRSPVVASAGPISQSVDGMLRLQEAGVGAVVMYSLFEEQLRHEEARAAAITEAHEESFAEAMSYFPTRPTNTGGITTRYLELLEQGASRLEVPLIASVNGATHGGWVQVARRMQDAGAAAVELNIYMVPGDVTTPGPVVEERHLEILAGVKQAVDIPVAVKLSPFFSSVGQMAVRLSEAGADGLVLFNRFVQPDIDIEKVVVEPGLELSTDFESRLPRTWIAALRGRVQASLAATTGVQTAEHVVKYILAGADVVMSTSALVRHGAAYAAQLGDGLATWLERKELTLDQARGMLAMPTDAQADAYERAGYVAALERAKAAYGR
ncbi:dihydroorotate dehydrogenase-like protein [Luteococcus peritonei]|uniref:Dihydroorotate dehydrogenase-like protein n=1 Tax=Luteococcus peritonei TaxID=88874 RepID=A0ABW4RWH3_9ACTN